MIMGIKNIFDLNYCILFLNDFELRILTNLTLDYKFTSDKEILIHFFYS